MSDLVSRKLFSLLNSPSRLGHRLLALSLAAVLTASAAGCGTSDNSADTARQTLPESLQDLSFEEHLNISVGYWNIEDMVRQRNRMP